METPQEKPAMYMDFPLVRYTELTPEDLNYWERVGFADCIALVSEDENA